ncbi:MULTISPECIES: CHAT domain-containing protein [unclassified Streptomyces]|uniref:CHAT domain-containing protein n=1 Tax=unclassified Streptomyces TaxID=2593676 RepID=UPI00131E61D7|nr:CHAT domain-containing protein [Streptomyces sp. CB01635]
MSERSWWLASLRRCLDRAGSDPARILEPEAERTASLLLAAIEPETDTDAYFVLGFYHWMRSQLLDQRAGLDDMDAVLRFMLPVFWADPELVPEPLRKAFRTHPGLAPLAIGKPEVLQRHAEAMVDAFGRSADLQNLRSAATYFRAAVVRTPLGHPDRLTRLNDLGVCLRDLYPRTENQALLAEAIVTERAALSLAGEGHGYARRVAALAHVLDLRAGCADEPAAYADVVHAVREALDTLPQSSPERPEVLSCLAGALGREYQVTGQLDTLDESLRAIREAVSLTPPNHPNRRMYLVNLTTALTAAHERTQRPGLLEEAAEARREVVRCTSDDDPAHVEQLSSLGDTLLRLSLRDREPGLLDETVKIGREAVAAVPQEHSDQVMHLIRLALALHLQYEHSGRADELESAAEALREAAGQTARGHSGRSQIRDLLITSLETLIDVHGRTDILDELIQCLRETVADLPPGEAERTERLDQLCALLPTMFELTGDPGHLEEAVRHGRAAVDATPREHQRRAGRLTNLGGALAQLHGEISEAGSSHADGADLLRAAVACEREAVALTPVGERKRPQYLNNLSSALQRVFARTGQVAFLEEAVEVSRQSVELTERDAPNRAMFLTNLGGAVRSLYLQTNRMVLLEEAVRAEREATALVPDGHPRRASHLNNLASTLQTLWMRTEEPDLLDEAIDVQRKAVQATPGRHPARAGRLIGLVSLLRMHYERTERMKVLAEAVKLAREALSLLPRDHPSAAGHLNGLVAVLLMAVKNAKSSVTVQDIAQFESPIEGAISQLLSSMPFLDAQALDEAVQAARDAVRLAENDHPRRAEFLFNLGHALEAKAEQSDSSELLDEALHCYREAGGSQTATAFLRISGHRRSAKVSARIPHQARSGLQAIEDAIQLLETFAPRSLVRPDRQYQLSQLYELPGEAAAAALHAGQTVRAVELLEQTRGILAADVLAQRSSEQTRLHALVPELAERLDRLRIRFHKLDPPSAVGERSHAAHGEGEPVGASARHQSEERVEVHRAWQELLARIRRQPGFGDFLCAPTAARLARQAQDGPIVFVTTSATRCDALILTSETDEPVQAVPLPGLTQEKAYDQANRLRTAHQRVADPALDPQRRIAAQREILDVLAWLWDVAAEPVLNRLGHTAGPADGTPWPRLWWCPIGVMAFLPLHAAGYHAELRGASPGGTTAPRTVLDRVVSSYTTTVGALEHARAHGSDVPTTVVVPVPDTPDSPLPGVGREVRAISALIPDAHLLTDPSRDKVLESLREHRIVHFACHARADETDPGRSLLILPDHSDAPLTVTDISSLQLSGALAYLAACETSVTTPRLADEALHITAAFQLAGYRHVVGTLWSVDDRTSVDMATDFYGRLTDQGTAPPLVERSAHALHYATRRLRDRYPGTPTLWAAHTHSGP